MDDFPDTTGRGRARGRGGRGGRPAFNPATVLPSARAAEDFAPASHSSQDTSSGGASSVYRDSDFETSSECGSELSSRMSTYSDVQSNRSSIEETVSSGGSSRKTVAPTTTQGGAVRTINPGFDKVGVSGSQINVVTNYYVMNQTPDFVLYQYRVDFTPVEDSADRKKTLLRKHQATIGNYIFDGSILYKNRKIPAEHLLLETTSDDGVTVFNITIRLVGQIKPEDPTYLQFYNIVMRKAMNMLGMEELGRNLYDRGAAIKFPQDHLELWPGFITAIRNHEMGTLLCVEVTHKVLRTSSVFDLMKTMKRPNMSVQDYEKEIREVLEDSIVMTHYNRRTYKVDNIDFKTTPSSSFRGQDGTIQTYADYYKSRYGIEIPANMMNQPMLVCLPKKKDINKGYTGNIYLVPSLCNPTGLSDEMRKNFQLMKRLSVHLHMDPKDRKQKLDEFMSKITENPAVQKEFAAWDIKFSAEALPSHARVFPREKIIVGPEEHGPIDIDDKGDWTRNLRNRHMLDPAPLKQWIVFCPSQEMSNVDNFLRTLKNMGKELGIEVAKPVEVVQYDVRRFEESTMDNAVKSHGVQLDLVFFILPNNQLRRYAEVKHYCTLKLGIPSQCFLAKNLTSRTLNSIATKVMIQITAKLGGIPWSIKVPLKRLMVLGFDVYHCSGRKGESAGGLVATSSPGLTSYVSVVSFHKDQSELASNMCADMATCLREYYKGNGFLPNKIVMYRDGVGEGQVPYVLSHEIQQMRVAIRDVYSEIDEEAPKLSFIIVTKKINSRAFLVGRKGYENLAVGTVLDQRITLPERYDFFMVSQDVRQGTVSPTNYNVVCDESGMTADQMQKLAYKMCHLYFNWSGTVAVPAPCQYAHKLAYITGVAVNQKAKEQLMTKLWYL